MALLEGSDPELKDKLVCIEAYYDSMSIVPALAPGAEAACSVATMLELAREFKANPPACSVLFLATSAHHLHRAGIFDFLHRYAGANVSKDSANRLPDLMISLDLSSQNRVVGATVEDCVSTLRSQHRYRREFLRHARRFRAYADAYGAAVGLASDEIYLNLIQPEGGGSVWSFLPDGIRLNGTAAVMGGVPAVSMVTVQDPRQSIDSPLDSAGAVNVSNLADQARFLAYALRLGLSDAELLDAPKMPGSTLRRFRGRLVTFDPGKSFVPDDPVVGGVGLLALGRAGAARVSQGGVGVRGHRIGVADAEGWFELLNAESYKYWDQWTIEGYSLDEASGDIVMAVDLGLEGAAQYPVDFTFDRAVKTRSAVLFPCVATDLYDLVDPRYLSERDKLSMFDTGNAQPFAYGYSMGASLPRTSTSAAYATVFSKPGMRLKIGVASSLLGQRMLFLDAESSQTRRAAQGLGYEMDQNRLIANTPFQVLRDMHTLNESRINMVNRYGIENKRLERLHTAAGSALEKARQAIESLQWDTFIEHARRGLGLESRAYPDVLGTANDVIKGIVFYMALLLPFAFFCERLFFAFPDLKRRIPAFVGIFAVSYLLLRLVHPAFRIVETSEVILLGIVILALCLIVLWISTRRFETLMHKMKQESARVHQTDVSRAGATASAFGLGVSNMRRRKVRTFLTCTAVVLLMFTVLSFTSVQTSLRPRKVLRPNTPAYQGALVRDRSWVAMKHLALEHLEGEFDGVGTLVRRSWLLPRRPQMDFLKLVIDVRSADRADAGKHMARAFGLVGFEPGETDVSGIDAALESGRWFDAADHDACILPDTMAERLGIGPEELGKARVHLLGMDVTVIGIVDAEVYNEYCDLDNERMTPLDYTTLSREALGRASNAQKDVSAIEGRASLETYTHLDVGNTVIMPYKTVLDLGGFAQSVAIAIDDGDVGERVSRLLDRMAVTVFVGENDQVMVYSSLAASAVGGMGNVIVPILIAALMILNTMSGSVHERLNEIGTYSSVGLAPSHIGALFLAEACVYAILGGVTGYVLGQLITRCLYAVGALGGLTLNYSSLASVMATVVVMITVVLSTIYPARMASRMAVPDVTRKWSLPEPKGDDWRFDFPFTVSGQEVAGLFVFFNYFFLSFEEQSTGRFYTADNETGRFDDGGVQGYRLGLRVWLAPYDFSILRCVRCRRGISGCTRYSFASSV